MECAEREIDCGMTESNHCLDQEKMKESAADQCPLRDGNSEADSQRQAHKEVASPSESSSQWTEKDDPMLRFLTLLAKVERPACANCESKDLSPMFYCNTCGQAMCATCKQKTHNAKMFSRHDVTNILPYSREPQRKCPVHGEVCIMFSPATESLLCINCFRDLAPDVRAQCLDLDTAYTQKCDKIQKGLKSVGDLEMKIKDEVSAYQALLKELHRNAMREESTVHVFSKILQGAITQTEEILIEAIKRELQHKEKNLEEKLRTLETLHSNVQAYLSLSSAFISSASKFELLKLASGLMERLTAIGAIVRPAKISSDCCSIASNFKSEFGQSLKALLHQDTFIPDLDVLNAKVASSDAGNQKAEECAMNQHVAHNVQSDDTVEHSKSVPLPFLGRSQSLLNISLNLERGETNNVGSSKSATKREPDLPSADKIPASQPIPTYGERQSGQMGQMSACATLPASRSNSKKREPVVQPHTLPLPKENFKKPKPERKLSSRSVSADNGEKKSPHYDVSQVELFATIQSHKAVNSNGAKNVLVTSLVGLRKSDRIDDKKRKEVDGSLKYGTLPTSTNQSGHVCVVKAMVHQGAETGASSGKTRPQSSDSARSHRRPPTPKQQQWDSASESSATRMISQAKRPTSFESQTSSIQLTAEQARDLMRALSAAHKNPRVDDKWAQPSAMAPPAATSSTVPNQALQEMRDLKKANLSRNDSFEGHEEAVQLLVDAVTELRQLCCSKGNCDHVP